MDCTTTNDKLSAYLDGELPAEQAAAVARHLRECRSCARQLARLQSLDEAVRELGPAQVPAGFAERVRAAGESRRNVVRIAGLRLPGLPAALMRAAAALMAALGLWLGTTVGQTVVQGTPPQAESAEAAELDTQIESLSATPPGSVADVYLAFLGEEDGGGIDDE